MLVVTKNGKPWIVAADTPNYAPSYETEKWKWNTMYTRTFEDWEILRNMGLHIEMPNEIVGLSEDNPLGLY